jgi:hypothetical protein
MAWPVLIGKNTLALLDSSHRCKPDFQPFLFISSTGNSASAYRSVPETALDPGTKKARLPKRRAFSIQEIV